MTGLDVDSRCYLTDPAAPHPSTRLSSLFGELYPAWAGMISAIVLAGWWPWGDVSLGSDDDSMSARGCQYDWLFNANGARLR